MIDLQIDLILLIYHIKNTLLYQILIHFKYQMRNFSCKVLLDFFNFMEYNNTVHINKLNSYSLNYPLKNSATCSGDLAKMVSGFWWPLTGS